MPPEYEPVTRSAAASRSSIASTSAAPTRRSMPLTAATRAPRDLNVRVRLVVSIIHFEIGAGESGVAEIGVGFGMLTLLRRLPDASRQRFLRCSTASGNICAVQILPTAGANCQA